jgi:hypothetical protein
MDTITLGKFLKKSYPYVVLESDPISFYIVVPLYLLAWIRSYPSSTDAYYFRSFSKWPNLFLHHRFPSIFWHGYYYFREIPQDDRTLWHGYDSLTSFSRATRSLITSWELSIFRSFSKWPDLFLHHSSPSGRSLSDPISFYIIVPLTVVV